MMQKQKTELEWDDADYRTNDDVLVAAWESLDGRFRIEEHPQLPGRYLLTDRGHFAGIYGSLYIAQGKAEKRNF